MKRSNGEEVDLASEALCPCGFGSSYSACCGALHFGREVGAQAPTALQLMRSRYSAFSMGLADYLLATWHASTRPQTLELDPDIRWLRLLIEATNGGGPFDDTGTVIFTAIGRGPDGRFEQRETSRFVRENSRWFYVDGE